MPIKYGMPVTPYFVGQLSLLIIMDHFSFNTTITYNKIKLNFGLLDCDNVQSLYVEKMVRREKLP